MKFVEAHETESKADAGGQIVSVVRGHSYPAKTPPARTRRALMAILPQNSGDPTGSSVALGGSWDRTCRRERTICVGVASRGAEPLLCHSLVVRLVLKCRRTTPSRGNEDSVAR